MRKLIALVVASLAGVVSAAPTVTLTWQDNSDNEMGFRVYRANNGVDFLAIHDVVANATAWADTTIGEPGDYAYRVTAFNAAGESAPSNTATVTIPAPGTLPNGATTLSLSIPGTLSNLSNRGLVTVGDATMIPGFAVSGGKVHVLIRVVGPTIGQPPYNVAGVCADPALSLRNSQGAEIAANDNWSGSEVSDGAAAVGAFALPAGSKDAAIVMTLGPGTYTVVTTANGAGGVALAEIYALAGGP